MTDTLAYIKAADNDSEHSYSFTPRNNDVAVGSQGPGLHKFGKVTPNTILVLQVF